MSKRRFIIPYVVLTAPGDDVVIGPGTGQSTTDPYACSYEEWQDLFEGDYDYDADLDFDDYVAWWYENGFSEEDWLLFNPDPLPPDPTNNP